MHFWAEKYQSTYKSTNYVHFSSRNIVLRLCPKNDTLVLNELKIPSLDRKYSRIYYGGIGFVLERHLFGYRSYIFRRVNKTNFVELLIDNASQCRRGGEYRHDKSYNSTFLTEIDYEMLNVVGISRRRQPKA